MTIFTEIDKKKFKEMLDRFLIGDPINDEELETLLTFYTDLSEKLEILGERFHFAWFDAYGKKERLESFKRARESRKIN